MASENADPPVAPIKTVADFALDLWTLMKRNVHHATSDLKTFEEFAVWLKKPATLEITQRFYRTLRRAVTGNNDKPATSVNRQLLSAFMISKFPMDVMDAGQMSVGESEHKQMSDGYLPPSAISDPISRHMYEQSLAVVKELVEKDVDELKNNPTVQRFALERLFGMLEDFRETFLTWRMKDEKKVVEALKEYWLTWSRSLRMMEAAPMAEHQKQACIAVMQKSIDETKRKIITFTSKDDCERIAAEIKATLDAEPAQPHPTHRSKQLQKAVPQPHHNLQPTAPAPTQPSPQPTTAEKLAARGVPSVIRSGVSVSPGASPSPLLRQMNEEKKEDQPVVLDLNKLIHEAASKKYWLDFGIEIEKGQFTRLFQLIAELSDRLKKLVKVSHHAALDDLMDSTFIGQSIERGLLDGEKFYGIFNALWEEMKGLHAPRHDANWVKFRDSVFEDMKGAMPWKELVPKIMNRLLVKLDQIEDEVRVYREAMKRAKS